MRIRGLFKSAYPRRKEERIKLAASGCQLLAIAIIGSGFIAPLFNPALDAPHARLYAAAATAAVLEGIAMILLGFIPDPGVQPATPETRNG